MVKFIKKDFTPPERVETSAFVCRRLTVRDVYDDYIAVMSSIDFIQKTRGGTWPTKDLTFEQDLVDLGWHQKEFADRSSFAYVVYDKNEEDYMGCFYLYPPGYRSEKSVEADVDVSWWVTAEKYQQGYYEKVYEFLKKWLKEAWGFDRIGFTNKEIPK